MSVCYIMLGKYGDQLSILPILSRRFEVTGEKPVLLVSSEYSQIAEPCPYIQTVVWDGSWRDLPGAVLFAKKHFKTVIVPQTYGAEYKVSRKHPSFQYDQWDRAGALAEWGNLPLRRPHINERASGLDRILIADHSQSSPFPQIEDLVKSLRERFPKMTIMRLSEVRKDNPWELLTTFDLSRLLITTETMHAHLSKASDVPVIALVADNPSRWHGSAFHPHYRMQVRYSDYELRKQDILRVAGEIIEGKDYRTEYQPIPELPSGYYNPSVLDWQGKRFISTRFHPDPKSWRSELVMVEDGKRSVIVPPAQYLNYSIEDGRLFVFDKKLHVSCTISRSALARQDFSPCITGYGELHRTGDAWAIKGWTAPRYGKNRFDGQEKNLVFTEHSHRLYCIWQCAPNHVVLELNGERVVREYKTPCPPCSYGNIRGGTQPIEYNGQWIRFVHAQERNPKTDVWWTYHLTALAMEPKPPFRITKIREFPILTGNEQYFPGLRHWKPKIVIPYGAVRHGNGFLVSYGHNDSQSRLLQVPDEMLKL